MKTFLYIILNLFAVFVSIWVYFFLIEPKQENLLITDTQLRFVIVLGLIVLAFIYMNSKFLKKLGIGFIPLILMGLIFLLLTVNKKMEIGSKVRTAELITFSKTSGKEVKLSVKLNSKIFRLDAGPEIFPVDSVEVVLQKGIFGLTQITDSVIIKPIDNCPGNYFSVEDEATLELARTLSRHRCLEEALKYYTIFIQHNPHDLSVLYERASIHLALQNYSSALNDLETWRSAEKDMNDQIGRYEQLIKDLMVNNTVSRIEYCKRKLKE